MVLSTMYWHLIGSLFRMPVASINGMQCIFMTRHSKVLRSNLAQDGSFRYGVIYPLRICYHFQPHHHPHRCLQVLPLWIVKPGHGILSLSQDTCAWVGDTAHLIVFLQSAQQKIDLDHWSMTVVPAIKSQDLHAPFLPLSRPVNFICMLTSDSTQNRLA